MATANPLNIIQGRYRLVLTPTNLAAAWPYGGTEMGLAKLCRFEHGVRTYTEGGEEWGAPTRRFVVGNFGILHAILRGEDAAALGNTFPAYVAGASGAPTILPDVNGSARAGTALTGALILAVPAESPAVLPAILIYNGLPAPEAAAEFAMSAKEEAGHAVSWVCAPDANGRTYFKGLLEDASL